MVESTIDVVHRGDLLGDSNYAIEADTVAKQSDPNPDLTMEEDPIYNLVIDHPEGTILWDSGAHPEAGEGHWPPWLFDAFPFEDAADHTLESDLAAAGWELDDIDAVVQTHLHMDHAGGLHNFEGTDVPVFVHEEELKYAYYSVATRKGSAGYVREDFDRNLNWEVVHLTREEHFEDVELLHLPGHTPGVLGLMVHLPEETVIFTSDLCDVAANYRSERPLGAGLMWNHQEWYESVRWVKDLERRFDATVVYGHDAEQFEAIKGGWG